LDSSFEIMHEFSGCAGDSPPSPASPIEGVRSWSIEGIYMATMLRFSLEHNNRTNNTKRTVLGVLFAIFGFDLLLILLRPI